MFVERLDHHEYIPPIQSHHPLDTHDTRLESNESKNAKIIAGFTTKNGGVSKPPFESLNTGLHVHDKDADVVENRKKIAGLFDTDLQSWVFADQTHEHHVRKVTHEDGGKGAREYSSAFKATDGLYTCEKNVFMALCFADCVPLFFMTRSDRLSGSPMPGGKGL